jgi:glycosyltransferase involved in cell wall biosynthesis|tara:strand:+ start:631 stop:1494 length:864 start_codon:yes stop_codon:yes gene_type:complete
MNNPLISVIITTYNRPDYLELAIESVVDQTYNDIEILVVDDGSKESYAENICNKYEQCIYHYKDNGGVSSARNYGVLNSKGKFIAFLDDDDLWRKDKLEKQLEILNFNKYIDLVHGHAEVIDINGVKTGKIIGASEKKVHKRSGYVFWNALGIWVVKSPTPLIRKKVFTKDLLFDETIKVGEDVDFYQRLFYRHKVYYINEPLAYYREYDNPTRLSTQKVKYLGLEKKMYANFLKMGVRNPITLHRIAIKLLRSAVYRKNAIDSKSKFKLSIFDEYIRPIKKLQKFN